MSGWSHTPTIQNRRARHEYGDDTIEAGLRYVGVKSSHAQAMLASLRPTRRSTRARSGSWG